MAPDALEQRSGRGVVLEEDSGASNREREQEIAAHGVAEVELGDRDRDVVLSQAEGRLPVELGAVGERAVGLHHRLGHPCRASGEDPHRRRQSGRVGGRHLVVGQLHPRVCHQRGRHFDTGRLQHPGDVSDMPRVHHHRRRPGQACDRAQGGRREARVDLDRHRSEAEDAEEGPDVLQAVGHHHQHPLLHGNAHAGQQRCEARGGSVHLGVGDGDVVQSECYPLPPTLVETASQKMAVDVETVGPLHGHGARS